VKDFPNVGDEVDKVRQNGQKYAKICGAVLGSQSVFQCPQSSRAADILGFLPQFDQDNPKISLKFPSHMNPGSFVSNISDFSQ
jgi:hypothetical protein